MKSLTFNFRIALPVLLCCVALARTASAQEAVSSWVKVEPPDKAFTVMMPRMPVPAEAGGSSGKAKVAGHVYRLSHDNVGYTIWSFKAENFPVAFGKDVETYLDLCAEMAWSLMIEPYWQKFKDKSPVELAKYNLTYDGDLPSPGHLGRRYNLSLDEQKGITHIYATGSQIYIVAAAGAAHESANVEEFIKSFTLNLPVPEVPARLRPGIRRGAGTGIGRGHDGSMGGGTGTGNGIGTGTGNGIGTGTGNSIGTGTGNGIGTGTGGGVGLGEGGGLGRGGNTGGGDRSDEAKEIDYNRTFSVREVTRKAQILAKPEPLYTYWAVTFGVTGTVRLRLVLRANGEVGGITPVTTRPHGLLEQAIKAARGIKFNPAEKDGRKVSQYVIIEYNFNIY